MSPYEWSDPSVTIFVILPLALVILFVLGVARAWPRSGASSSATRRATVTAALGGAVWMALTGAAAASGVLAEWERTPPPFMLLLVAILMVAGALAFGPVGRRFSVGLSLSALVAVQAFRFPLELAMHRMYERGIMPVQMSYSGRNFDVITGLTAIIVAWLVATGRAGRGLVAGWNVLGLTLLTNVVVVAVVSTPRFRLFGDQQLNVWVTYPPFVWLPAVMVLAALAGHLLIFRALSRNAVPISQARDSRTRV
jgi:hypothetical protein